MDEPSPAGVVHDKDNLSRITAARCEQCSALFSIPTDCHRLSTDREEAVRQGSVGKKGFCFQCGKESVTNFSFGEVGIRQFRAMSLEWRMPRNQVAPSSTSSLTFASGSLDLLRCALEFSSTSDDDESDSSDHSDAKASLSANRRPRGALPLLQTTSSAGCHNASSGSQSMSPQQHFADMHHSGSRHGRVVPPLATVCRVLYDIWCEDEEMGPKLRRLKRKRK